MTMTGTFQHEQSQRQERHILQLLQFRARTETRPTFVALSAQCIPETTLGAHISYNNLILNYYVGTCHTSH